MSVSLSWGAAGDMPWGYQTGVNQIKETFGLEVIPAPNSNRPADWIYRNPEARAEDIMTAFADSEIKGIVSNIGGEDSVRTLPFIDLSVIANNPKVFVGFSDTTVQHIANVKAGIVSFYGPSLFAGFAENGGVFPYLEHSFRNVCFSSNAPGQIMPNQDGWTNEHLDWADQKLSNQKRKLEPSIPWKFFQDEGVAEGPLLGGCIEVLEMIKGTEWFPGPAMWEGAVFFLETSEDKIKPDQFRWILRNYAAMGVFKKISALLVGRPYGNVFADEYDAELLKVIREEEGLDLPIVSRMDFGHSEPMMTLPYGINAKIDSGLEAFYITEAAVC